MTNAFVVRASWFVMTLSTFAFAPAVNGQAGAADLLGRAGQSGEHDSGWLQFHAPIDFRRGEELRLLVGGKASRVVVRLLPDGCDPSSTTGIVGVFEVPPSDRVIRVALQTARVAVRQVSVHGGDNPWGQFFLGNGNGAASLVRVTRVPPTP